MAQLDFGIEQRCLALLSVAQKELLAARLAIPGFDADLAP